VALGQALLLLALHSLLQLHAALWLGWVQPTCCC
jgi:hypothetical protein